MVLWIIVTFILDVTQTKHAVRRNRLRRLFREAFRLEKARVPVAFDLVMIPWQPRACEDLEQVRSVDLGGDQLRPSSSLYTK